MRVDPPEEDMGTDPPGEDMDESAPTRCDPDAAQLAEGRACLSDDACPCGAHCALGRCVSTCTSAADCAEGEFCDAFGRCRALADTSEVALRAPSGKGRLVMRQSLLNYIGDGVPRRMTLVARGGAVDQARIVSDERTMLALPQQGVEDAELDFGEELFLMGLGLEEGDRLEVVVQPSAGVMLLDEQEDFGTASVKVFDDSGKVTVATVTDREPEYVAEEAAFTPIEGIYTGRVVLERSGVEGAGGSPGGSPLREVSAPITALVYPAQAGRATFVLEDPMRLMSLGGRLTGEITLEEQPRLELPDYLLADGRSGLLGDVQIVGDPQPATLQEDPTADGWSGALTVSLDIHMKGATSGGYVPVQSWRIELQQDRPIDPNAQPPPIPEDVSLAYDPVDLADTPLVGEEAFVTTLTDMPWLGLGVDVYVRSLERDRWGELSGSSFFQVCNVLEPFQYPGYGTLGTAVLTEPHGLPLYRGPNASILGLAYEGNVPWSLINAQEAEGVVFSQAPGFRQMVFEGMDVRTQGSFDDINITELSVRYAWSDKNNYEFTISSGVTLERAVPCGFDMTQASPISSQSLPGPGVSIALDPTNVDFEVCELMRQRYGCEVIDLVELGVSEADRSGEARVRVKGDVNGEGFNLWNEIPGLRYTKACVVPLYPTSCIETLTCTRGDDQNENVTLSTLGTSTLDASGDLDCAASDRGGWFAMDDGAMSADMLLEGCIEELEQLRGLGPRMATGDSSRSRLDSIGWNDAHVCLNPVRLSALLSMSGAEARELGRLSAVRAPNESDALFLRYLQRLVELHAFVASEAHNGQWGRLALDEQVDRAGLAESLKISLGVWEAMAHPRLGDALIGISPGVLAEPDYRTWLISAPPQAPHYTQRDGIAVSMVRAMTAQVELAQVLARQSARRGDTSPPAEVYELLGHLHLAEAHLQRITSRAQEFEPMREPEWMGRYRLERQGFEAAHRALLDEISVFVDGADPLGIAEDELPLYFRQVSSRAGINARYGAISDYLIGDGAAGAGVVSDMVADAEASFEAARQAYRNEQERLVNVANNEADLQFDITNVKKEFGQTLQDYCGAEAFPGLSAEQIPDSFPEDFDANTCWFRSERPECQPPPRARSLRGPR